MGQFFLSNSVLFYNSIIQRIYSANRPSNTKMRIRLILLCALVILTCSPCDSKLLRPNSRKTQEERSLQYKAYLNRLSSDQSSQAQCPTENVNHDELEAEDVPHSDKNVFFHSLSSRLQTDHHQFCLTEGPAPLNEQSACTDTLHCPPLTEVENGGKLHRKVPKEYQQCTQCAGT